MRSTLFLAVEMVLVSQVLGFGVRVSARPWSVSQLAGGHAAQFTDGVRGGFVAKLAPWRKMASWRAASTKAPSMSATEYTYPRQSEVSPATILVPDEAIEKPTFDSKSYRAITLPNGLRALLISDPNSEMGGAAMNIHAGSWADPPGFSGLAHFHEHMVFLGTDKYPGENEYDAYLSTNGGFSNAYTADEDTNFYFECLSNALEGSMDRFCQFFRCPTFDKNMVDREVRAIDSEHNNNVPMDGRRLNQVFKRGLRSDHPSSGFSTGNLETLLPPARSTDELHEALVKFRATWYRTDRMTLAVQGQQSLDELEKMVTDTGFGEIEGTDDGSVAESALKAAAAVKAGRKVRSDVPRFKYGNGNPFAVAEGDETSKPGPGLDGGVAGVMRWVVPVNDRREVSLVFPLDGAADQDGKPHRYVTHCLGHEGPGSLLDILQAKGWAESVSAGVSLMNDDCHAFKIGVQLTEAGEANLDGVLDLVFETLALMREVPTDEALCNEMAAMAQMEFTYQDQVAANRYVSRLASSLYDYEPASVLSGPVLIDPKAITKGVKATTDRLTPSNAIITVASLAVKKRYEDAVAEGAESVAAKEWSTERWYGTIFQEATLSSTDLERWANAGSVGTKGLTAVPGLNPFMPTESELNISPDAEAMLAESGPESKEDSSVALVVDERDIRVHLVTPSLRFRAQPKMSVLVHVMTPATYESPEASMLCRLFVRVVLAELNSYAYDATVAGMGYVVMTTSSGFLISMTGFESQVPTLLRTIVSRMQTVIEQIEQIESGEGGEDGGLLEQRFEQQRELLLQTMRNTEKDAPYKQASYWLNQVMEDKVWHVDEYSKVLEDDSVCNLQAVAAAAKRMMSDTTLEVLLTGGGAAMEGEAGPAKAAAIGNELRELLPNSSEGPSTTTTGKSGTVKLPTEPESEGLLLRRIVRDPTNENSAVQMHFQTSVEVGDGTDGHAALDEQVGFTGDNSRMSVTEHAALDVIARLAYPSIFKTLRTQQQLGYLVSGYAGRFDGIAGLTLVCQSSNTPPPEIQRCMDEWMVTFGDEILAMSEEDISTNAKALAASILQKSDSMLDQHQIYAGEIQQMRYDFNRRERRAPEVANVTKADVVAAWNKWYAPGVTTRKPLMLHFYSTKDAEAEGLISADTCADDADADGSTDGSTDERTVLTDLASLRSFKEGRPKYPSVALKWWS